MKSECGGVAALHEIDGKQSNMREKDWLVFKN